MAERALLLGSFDGAFERLEANALSVTRGQNSVATLEIAAKNRGS